MDKSVVVFGPQGCGKTYNARRLAGHFGLRHWRDWTPGDPVPVTGHLLLSNQDPRTLEAAPGRTLTPSQQEAKSMRRVYAYSEVAHLAGIESPPSNGGRPA